MANNPTDQSKTNSGPATSAEEKTQNQNQNRINLQEKKNKDHQISTPISNKKIGAKRLGNDSSPSVSNGHLVYVRRKLETEKNNVGKDETVIKGQNKQKNVENEQGKIISSDIGKDETVIKDRNERNEQGKIMNGKDEMVIKGQNGENYQNEKKMQNEINEKKMQNEKNVENEKNAEKTEKNVEENEKKVEKKEKNVEKNDEKIEKKIEKNETKEEWKERFLRLQAFLRNLDQSNQDDYMRMLRSLSAVGRSKHAVELEKRAIHLLIEEGKELHRMKILNVLGKNSQTEPAELSSPVQPQLERHSQMSSPVLLEK